MERRWIWPFELLDKLGEGGMGVVYRARYVKNDKIVAVKLLPASITDETLLARFEREMQLLRTLRHPHIVHTFGGKCEGDLRFYAMELIEGGNIDDLLRDRKKLSVDTTVAYALQMCSALAYAHDKGITHRDIKPGNFLLTKDGTLKLADFGLATVAAANKLTATGKTMGTFRYMAPEQIRGKPEPCPQTDLYALGIVLFEMLTGKVPFDAETPAEVLHLHLKTPPPRVSSVVPSVPKPLDDLIDRMLRKSIDERPASAVEVGVALKSLDETVRVSERRTVETTSPPTEAERVFIASPMTDETPGVREVPRWAIAIPTAIALLALFWAWSRGDEVDALKRVETMWIGQLMTGGIQERVLAAKTLGEIGTAGDDTVKSLTAALDDPEPTVRAAAATALGGLGSDAKEASGKIFRLAQQDDRPEVRTAAVEAHRKITGETLK
ncbi:MAG: serine/threonine protein kinase [Planctomycetaceae bacterium]|nr:serine/threonine protein kinase [Planctomycetaceae bacterium]